MNIIAITLKGVKEELTIKRNVGDSTRPYLTCNAKDFYRPMFINVSHKCIWDFCTCILKFIDGSHSFSDVRIAEIYTALQPLMWKEEEN